MFKLAKNPTFRADVSVTVPTDEGPLKQSFKARFNVLDKDATELPVPDFLRAAVLSVEGVVDEDDTPIPHSAELLEQLIELPYAAKALVQAYFTGLIPASAGN